MLARIPENLNFIEAGSVPEAFITANDVIFTQGNLQTGETLLIHAVGSGVGLAALQLAKAKNVKTFGTSRTPDKLEKCKLYGLDEAILVGKEPSFSKTLKEKTKGAGVEMILDLVGAVYFQENLESLAIKGRFILVGLTSGAKTEFNMATALAKRLKIIGTVLRSRSTEEKAEATKKFIREVLPLIEKKLVKPNVDKVFELIDIQKAHEYLESNQSFGKVVLKI